MTRWNRVQFITKSTQGDGMTLEAYSGHRILMVVSEAPPIKSGVGKVIGELKTGLELKGHRVDILSSLDIPRYSFGEIRLSTLIFHWLRLRHLLNQYDLINIHAPAPTFADFFLILASRFGFVRRQKLVLTYHCEIDLPGRLLQPLTRLYSSWHKRLANLATHTIVTTPSYAKMFSGIVPEGRLSVIAWGVNEGVLHTNVTQKTEQRFQIAFVGQLRPYKGLDVLLHAMAGLPSVHLSIIGNGHHAESYRQLASDLALSNVSFLGAVSDEELQRVLKEAHALVLPSRTRAEAFGIVLVEAMAAGCVPIASNLPGVCDVVGHAGFTFPVGDSEALMKLLDRLAQDPALVQKYAAIAQSQAHYYTWQRCIDAHDQVFRSLIAEQTTSTVQKPIEIGYQPRPKMLRVPASG
ncbi:MAG: glycosyltransferase family 4 protein [Caldilineaceae bacterium]